SSKLSKVHNVDDSTPSKFVEKLVAVLFVLSTPFQKSASRVCTAAGPLSQLMIMKTNCFIYIFLSILNPLLYCSLMLTSVGLSPEIKYLTQVYKIVIPMF
uniref:Uncharacterized protein n=1 Tax=Romanomermis culicivorax TaxID=13658 RepID=A0A915HNB9_ROMCU